MRLIHISDIHGDIEAVADLRKVLEKRKDIDAVTCSGDLLGTVLDKQSLDALTKSRNYLMNSIGFDGTFTELMADLRNALPRLPSEIEKAIANHPQRDQITSTLNAATKAYVAIEAAFSEGASHQYEKIQTELSHFPQPVIVVPGNWDTHQFQHHFNFADTHVVNLHRENHEMDGITIAGYGGLGRQISQTPDSFVNGSEEEESFAYLQEQNPDIALVHVPPYGLLDNATKDPNSVKIGSPWTRSYIAERRPLLLLCGHAHDSPGNIRLNPNDENSTMVVNPGNLGRFAKNGEIPTSGRYAEIELDQDAVRSITHKNIYQNEGRFRTQTTMNVVLS